MFIFTLRDYKDYTWFANKTVPNNGQKRIVHSIYALFFVRAVRYVISYSSCCPIISHYFYLCIHHHLLSLLHMFGTPFSHTHVPHLWGLVRILKFCTTLSSPIWYVSLVPDCTTLSLLEKTLAGFFPCTCLMTRSWPTHLSNCAWFRDLLRNKLLAISDSCLTNSWNTCNTVFKTWFLFAFPTV